MYNEYGREIDDIRRKIAELSKQLDTLARREYSGGGTASLPDSVVAYSGTPTAGRLAQWTGAGTVEQTAYPGSAVVQYTGAPAAGAVPYWTGAGTVAASAIGTSQIALLGTPNSGTATSGTAFSVTRNLAAASTDSPVAVIHQDHASDDQDALVVRQDGTGNILTASDGGTVVSAILDGGQLRLTPLSTTAIALAIYDANDIATGGRFTIQTAASGTTSTDGFAFVFANPNTFIVNYETGSIYFWTSGASQMELDSSGRLGLGTAPTAKLHVNQSNTGGAMPALRLDQFDVSEEFIRFNSSAIGAASPIGTAALGTYYGKVRAHVQGVGEKWIALYNP